MSEARMHVDGCSCLDATAVGGPVITDERCAALADGPDSGEPGADLVTWLRAQLDEDERVAQAAGEQYPRWYASTDGDVNMEDTGGSGYLATGPWGGSLGDAGVHMARWDPARVLAEVDAKRRIIAEYEADDATLSPEHWTTLEDVIRTLAPPYADRPGYREEWRP